jgi:parvulin-like peptidyl-prolyl isomerase
MKKLIGAGILVLVALSACGKNGQVVAKIGSDKITVKTLQERIQETPPTYQGYLSTNAGKKQFLDLMVRERVVLESAKAAGYDKKDDYKKAVADFKKEQDRRERDYKENLLMELYVRDLHDSKQIGVSDEEVAKYYQDHQSEFAHPQEVVAQHILVPTKEEAEKVLARVKGGEDFATVAKEVSTDPVSASRGGQIGPFRKGDLVPEFENAVFSLKPGQISGIVQTQFGYHVIRKVSEKALPPVSADQAKVDIKKILEKAKFDAWIEQAKKKEGVTVDYNALSKVQPPQPPAMPKGLPAPEQGTQPSQPSK